jgi:ribosomal protein L24E
MPDGSKILERDGKVVVRDDGTIARDCDPDCCGPTECDTFARMTPCGSESPDPACTIPPGKGELYVCTTLRCANNGNITWPDRPEQGIYYNGVCWRWTRGDPTYTRAEIPEGADFIDSGTVDCNTCDDPRCGAFQYAEAIPCNPNLPRPWPLFCPAGLPVECAVIGGFTQQPHWLGQCFRFDRGFGTQPYPPGTPVLIIPPPPVGVPYATDCCTCQNNCPKTSRSFPRRCPPQPDFELTCCCGNLANAFVVYSGENLIDFYSVDIGGNVFRAGRITETWSGVSNATGVWTRSTQNYNANGTPNGPPDVQTNPLPPFGATCPLSSFPDFSFVQCESPCVGGGSFTPPTETRSCDFWSISGAYDCSNTPNAPFISPGARVTSQASARLLGMVPLPGCSQEPCGGGFALATGGPTATAARPVDPNVAAFMQQHYGGCRGCGQPEVPI